MKDEVGNEIKVGDTVIPTVWDASRGTSLLLLHAPAEVLSLGRTRIKIQSTAVWSGSTDTVGPECVKVVKAVDGRSLRDWSSA